MIDPPATVFALASKQVWPHVLTLTHFRPKRLILLHSRERDESEEPARRLWEFVTKASGLDIVVDPLEIIPDDNFTAIQQRLETIFSQKQTPLETTAINFTGGNKLMAMAAFEWARGRGLRAFYLERNNKLIQFKFDLGQIRGEPPIKLNVSGTNGLDAIELLTCQLGPGVLRARGERLRLNQKGEGIPLAQVNAELRKDVRQERVDFRRWLDIDLDKAREEREGDSLEYGVAVMLLRLGVPQVYRSVEFKPNVYSQLTEGELDLVFNWNGRLWVVDCKDKVGSSKKLENLKTALVANHVDLTTVQQHFAALAEDLSDKDIKVLREDLFQVSEVGGLLGSAIAVRNVRLPQQAKEFADSRRPRVEVILKDELEKRLRRLLL